MNKSNTYPKNGPRLDFAVLILAAVSLLYGCSESKSGADQANADHHDHDHHSGGETLLASVPHSHQNANETCFICDPSKRDKGRLWCREHGRYEDRCWICHPELEDKSRLWCKEHSLYEDECHLCHPELKKTEGDSESKAQSGAESALLDKQSQALFCNEHNVPEAECGICQPELAASLLPGDEMKVRFASKDSATKAGIRVGTPRVSESYPVFSAYCETNYNLNSMAKVTPLVGGVIRKAFKDVGETVNAGDAIVELHSAEVAAVKSAYLSAVIDQSVNRQSFERETRLREQSVTSEKELLEAQAAFRTTSLAASNLRQKLINLGLSEAEIARVESDQDTSASLVIRAPFTGTLIERSAVAGEAVDVGSSLYTLADLSTRWLELSIPSDYVGQVKVGQEVEAVFSDLPGVTISGRITWVDTSVDPRTRMIRARAETRQGVERLAAGLFGDAYISIGEERPSAVVPKNSVQRHEGSDFVFVQREPDLFALRRVVLSSVAKGEAYVGQGLRATDLVVTDGSFIVMSEFLKSRLGAGCAH